MLFSSMSAAHCRHSFVYADVYPFAYTFNAGCKSDETRANMKENVHHERKASNSCWRFKFQCKILVYYCLALISQLVYLCVCVCMWVWGCQTPPFGPHTPLKMAYARAVHNYRLRETYKIWINNSNKSLLYSCQQCLLFKIGRYLPGW